MISQKRIGFIAGCVLMAVVFFNITTITEPESAGQETKTQKIHSAEPPINKLVLPAEPTADPVVSDTKIIEQPEVETTATTIVSSPEALTNTEALVNAANIPIKVATDEVLTDEIEQLTEQLLSTTEQIDIFWGPFNSSGRAKEFAGYLQSLSKVPLLIVHKKNGYSIAFRYDSQQQQQTNRQVLSKKSGLTLRDLNK